MGVKRLKKEVERALDLDPKCRNSDIYLTIFIWQTYYGCGEAIQLNKMYDLPSQDNIKRIRAKFQNEEHKYPPTDWVIAKKRNWSRENWERELGYIPKVDLPKMTQAYKIKAGLDKELNNKLFDVEPLRKDIRWN